MPITTVLVKLAFFVLLKGSKWKKGERDKIMCKVKGNIN
jgi:hypothetical protein